ncbi:hypothetical protein FF2_020978 [Malus domestica]
MDALNFQLPTDNQTREKGTPIGQQLHLLPSAISKWRTNKIRPYYDRSTADDDVDDTLTWSDAAKFLKEKEGD